MGWELTNFKLASSGRQASAFHFEVVFKGSFEQAECLYRGDGILTQCGSVRVNREHDLADAVAGLGLDSQIFMQQLSDWVVKESQPPVANPL